jgi:hypothetical protein
MPISRPTKHHPYPDREIDCQQAIERAFQDLMANATAAGWDPAEAAEAIEQLALADRWTRNDIAAIAAYRLLDDLVAARQNHD